MAETKHATAFISGPLDPTDEYFDLHYKPKIDAAISENHDFIIGPVRGIDALALQYLISQNVTPTRITIYMAAFECASTTWRSSFTDLGVNVFVVEEAVTTRDRDAAMTRDSDYDILRYRSEAEAKELYGSSWWPRVSNTEMNERRRKGILSQAYTLEEGHASEQVEGGHEEQNLGMGKSTKAENAGKFKRSKLRKLFGKD